MTKPKEKTREELQAEIENFPLRRKTILPNLCKRKTLQSQKRLQRFRKSIFNLYYDRQLNNWLHKYVYKKNYPNSVGCSLRTAYEDGTIKSEKDFKEVLNHVLPDCKEV